MKKSCIFLKAASLLLCAPMITGTFTAAAPVDLFKADAVDYDEEYEDFYEPRDYNVYYYNTNSAKNSESYPLKFKDVVITNVEYSGHLGSLPYVITVSSAKNGYVNEYYSARLYLSSQAANYFMLHDIEELRNLQIFDIEVKTDSPYIEDCFDFDNHNGYSADVSEIVRISPAGTHFYGDVNDDGYVDSYDLILLRQEIQRGEDTRLSEDQFKNADINKNGELDGEDLMQLNDYILGSAIGSNTPSEIGSVRLDNNVSVEAEKGVEPDEKFAAAQMKFGINMLKQINTSVYKKNNMLVSPFSAAAALAMTANGADGETLKEMEEVIGNDMTIDELDNYMAWFISNLPNTEKEKVLVADSIWFKDMPALKVYDSFLEANKKFFNAEIYKTPFDRETVKDINSWVNTNTKGMIPKLLEDDALDNNDDEQKAMALINTVYFDAKWENPYRRSTTTDFTNKDGVKKEVEGLYAGSNNYYELDNALAFKKPYAGKYQFVGILPDEGIDIDDYIAGIDPEKLSKQLRTPGDMENTIVSTMIPEFEYDYNCTLNDTLKQMGMKSAFDGELADFSKINDLSVEGAGPLYISSVIQKTNIKLTKEGTKAAAATAVIMTMGSAGPGQNPPRYIDIYLERPFVYMIIDENDVPLFIGAVTDIGK